MSLLSFFGRKRRKWKVGDLFALPLDNGRFAFGQLAELIERALPSCVFFDKSGDTPEQANEHDLAIAFLFVTDDLLASGRWQVVRNTKVIVPRALNKNEPFRQRNWIGADIIGSANVEHLLNAWNGLRPWDDWDDPRYLDGLLIDPLRKPQNLIYVKTMGL